MKAFRHLLRAAPAFFKAVVACVLMSWIAALAMAVSPRLHEHVHEDADHDDHECVVTHLLAGDVGDGVPLLIISVEPSALATTMKVVASPTWVCPLHRKNGVLEHGPPALG
jgi:hypothetical protein